MNKNDVPANLCIHHPNAERRCCCCFFCNCYYFIWNSIQMIFLGFLISFERTHLITCVRYTVRLFFLVRKHTVADAVCRLLSIPIACSNAAALERVHNMQCSLQFLLLQEANKQKERKNLLHLHHNNEHWTCFQIQCRRCCLFWFGILICFFLLIFFIFALFSISEGFSLFIYYSIVFFCFEFSFCLCIFLFLFWNSNQICLKPNRLNYD